MRISDWSSDVCSSDLHKELPKDSLVAVAPINLRGKGGKAATPGNQVSAMSVPVRTDLAGPLDRLAAIRYSPVEAKEAQAGVSARIMNALPQHITGETMAASPRPSTTRRSPGARE